MIKKLAIILLLVGLFCYFIAAVTVLNKPKEGLVCNGVEVVVEDSLQTGFIQSGEVLRLLEGRKCNPTGQKMDQVMLSRIEEALRKNPYIEDVTSYKTPGGKVCVRVKQRLPILHVMSSDGQNYYLDRAGRQMPKSSYYADLVVATGDITPQYARQNLTRLGRLIQDNPADSCAGEWRGGISAPSRGTYDPFGASHKCGRQTGQDERILYGRTEQGGVE